jgi:hypothetical protein
MTTSIDTCCKTDALCFLEHGADKVRLQERLLIKEGNIVSFVSYAVKSSQQRRRELTPPEKVIPPLFGLKKCSYLLSTLATSSSLTATSGHEKGSTMH